MTTRALTALSCWLPQGALLAALLLTFVLAAHPARGQGAPVAQPVAELTTLDPAAAFALVNGQVQAQQEQGRQELRWSLPMGQSAELNLNRDHPLFSRLRYFDRLIIEYQIVSGQISALELRARGHVSGPRALRVHQFGLAVATTATGQWHRRELELARPNWFEWNDPDGDADGGVDFFSLRALATAPNTVIVIRTLRLATDSVYLKPFFETPISWPVKSVNTDGSVSYRIDLQVLNVSGKPATIAGAVRSQHRHFQVALEPVEQLVRSGEIGKVTVTAQLAAADIGKLPELYAEPLEVGFFTQGQEQTETRYSTMLVRPLSPGFRRQVLVPARDVAQLQTALAAKDPKVLAAIDYQRLLTAADKFLPIELAHIPGGHTSVSNGMPMVPNSQPPRPVAPGAFMPQIILDAAGKVREVDTPLAQRFWKEYLGYSGRATDNLGWAYLFTGDERYAEKAVELMTLYARQYTQIPLVQPIFDPPWNPGPPVLCASRASVTSSYGSNWLFKGHCRMMSLTADSPAWTDEVRSAVYRGFVLPYAAELIKFPGTLSNQTDITSHNLLLLGLCFDDAGLVWQAAMSDAGLVRRLEDIDEDGFSSEGRPLNYHLAAMDEYVPALTFLANSGLQVAFPKQRLLAALRMPYERATLAGSVPITGDNGGGGSVRNHHLADDLSAIFPDEKWLGEIGTASTLSTKLRLQTQQRPDPEAWQKLLSSQPRLFRQAGMAILRSGQTPQTQIMATFDYGRNPFHGGLDRLQLTLWAMGKTFTHGPGSLYNAGSTARRDPDPRLTRFCSHGSLGFNVVMVDQSDQLPAMGQLLAYSGKPEMQFAVSKLAGAYPGVEHIRGVVLTRGLVLVLDKLQADQPHTFDFVYHNVGQLSAGEGWSSSAAPPLGNTANYDSLISPQRLTGAGPLRLTWNLTLQTPPVKKAAPAAATQAAPDTGPWLDLWQMPLAGGEIYTASSGMNNPNTRLFPDEAPTLIHRLPAAKQAQFLTVLEPRAAEAQIASVSALDSGGLVVRLRDGSEVRVELDKLIAAGIESAK